jgi:hypothetical protein
MNGYKIYLECKMDNVFFLRIVKYEEFIDMVLESTLQLTLKKWPFIVF